MSSATTSSSTKEYPIIFKPDMAKAIREDRKTQTRRFTGLKVINGTSEHWKFIGTTLVTTSAGFDTVKSVGTEKPSSSPLSRYKNPHNFVVDGNAYVICQSKTKAQPNTLYAMFRHLDSQRVVWVRSPYGNSGDVLWVRENRCMLKDGTYKFASTLDKEEQGSVVKTTPSIHVKRADAELLLNVEEVTIERLWDISGKDAIAEGIDGYVHALFRRKVWRDYESKEYPSDKAHEQPQESFFSLIRCIHGPDIEKGYPFVWVVKFSVNDRLSNISSPEKQPAR